MNREEAIELLRSWREGVKRWNAWRKDNPEAKLPDLSEANLSRANLGQSDLNKANLSGANLSRAELHGADLFGAELSEADLTGADLCAANLRGANLVGTELVNCRSGYTSWTDLDLSKAKGLETIRHERPSTVGVDTLVNSKGRIPETFLRGCGVPESLIEFLPSLLCSMQPIQFYSCFISHSSKDKEFCRRLYARMQEERLRVWFDEADMPWGQKLHDALDVTIKQYDKLLLVLSSDSINSEWVKTEIRRARDKELREKRRVLFPIRLCDFQTIREWKFPDGDTGQDLAREIRENYIPGDFEKWKQHDAFEAAFAKLLEGLKASAVPVAGGRV
jgi:hypothetical protein